MELTAFSIEGNALATVDSSLIDPRTAPIATLARREVFGDADQAIEVVVPQGDFLRGIGGVGDGRRDSGARAGGGGGGLCRAPALDEFAARAVALAGDQPLGASLGGAADRVTVGVVGLVGEAVAASTPGKEDRTGIREQSCLGGNVHAVLWKGIVQNAS